jgi:hypothetical protein
MKYKFDYIKEVVDSWNEEVKKRLTKDMIINTPYYVTLPYVGLTDTHEFKTSNLIDYYGQEIDDFEEWNKEREEYIDRLFEKLTKERTYENR